MASSSSSSVSDSQSCSQWKYDVFLSFRGDDTRKTFTGHLYKALKNRGIVTFQDDKMLEGGDSISEELLKAIEESQVAIIVFSRNYATSPWCLDELAKIMKCKEQENRRAVIPIFYDVDPSHVRYQSKSFADAFSKHESRYKNDVEGMQKVQAWKAALADAAGLSGYNIRDGIESEIIEKIVDYISSEFCKSARYFSYLQDVVGIEAHLQKLKSQLQIEINDVQFLGIWGIGGVGKTTIAKALFDTLSDQFNSACFLEDVKENAKNNKLHSLQNILLSKLLRKKYDYVDNKLAGMTMISSRLRSMKVLIVLDDIDHGDQLEYLAGDVGWFGNGSRVIVTTRDRHLIEKDVAIYEVPTLSDHEAMQLFNQHAFKREVPDERFKELSLEVVNHAKGLPLALKVWGSSLHKTDLIRWRSTVKKIKKNSNSEIVEKLKISYDGLELDQQKIFLDIVCFFRHDNTKKVKQILESCSFEAECELGVLIDKSLVFISEYNTIEMHDLIEEMGKYIMKMQKDLGKLSRIWNVEDFEDVMVGNTGTIAVEVEAIWIRHYDGKLRFSNEAMKNMQKLRILSIRDGLELEEKYALPVNKLCWFDWWGCPWKLLPQNFIPASLVHLQLPLNSLHLWNQTKELKSLRGLHLSWSHSLKSTPDFTGMPNLEYLDLSSCYSLEEVHPSLRYSTKLIELNLSYCKSLERFPYVNVESLESLYLSHCNLEKFPEIHGRMKPELKITMESSGLREIPSSIIHLLVADLTELDLRRMQSLESLPEEIGDLENLEELDASSTLISRPPSSIVRLNKLKVLNFAKYKTENIFVHFVFPQVNEGLHSLEYLNLRHCNLTDGGLPEDIGSLSSLKELNLMGNNFEHLPRSIAQLGALQSLNLSACKKLKELPCFTGMPNLEYLDLSHSKSLEEVHPSLRYSTKLTELNLKMCKSLERFPYVNVESLESLDLKYCSSLEKFPEIHGRMKPKLNITMESSGLREIPSSIIHLLEADLTELNLSSMKNLVSLPSSICKLKGLVKLDVSCSKLESLPEEIGDLENLEELDARDTLISRPPSSLVRLNKLKFLTFAKYESEDRSVCFVFPQVNEGLRSLEDLDLSRCNLTDGGLPEDIGSLSSLKELDLRGNNFEHLPRSIAQLGALRSLVLPDCEKLKELPDFTGMPNLESLNLSKCNLTDGAFPEDIGSLSSLKKLNLSGNNFEHLPRSIAQLGALQILDLSDCKRLTLLPKFPQQLYKINADWSSDSICNSLFRNISSLQHDISDSGSLSLRVFTSWVLDGNIPSWFHHQGISESVSVNLCENWYASDNFLGFAVCYSGRIFDITAHLIPLCDDGTSSMTQKFALSNHSKFGIHFCLVPLAGLWDASKANGKTPNDYGRFRLFSTGEMKFGVRLLYKDEPELHRYEEACCCFPLLQLFPTRLGL